MSECRYDRESGEYLTPDGKPCLHDEHGDPTRHCQARRTCSQHVGFRELTCARCLGRVRQTIRKIRDHTPLLPPAAELAGINSEAAYLAGPAADVEAWSWRKIAAKQGVAWHVSLIEEDDDWHPYTVLTRWEFMLREDYGERRDTPASISAAADYLDRKLAIVAQDENQDFSQMRRELNTCWNHMQIPLAIKPWVERGAPCPECKAEDHFVRLNHEHGHWCTDPDCERIHYLDDSGDRWVCPRNREHAWTEKAYRDYIEERTA